MSDAAAAMVPVMTKRSTPTSLAKGLTAGERMVLLCAASGMDWQQSGIPAETVTAMVMKELIERHVGGRLRLTGYGRVVLRAMLTYEGPVTPRRFPPPSRVVELPGGTRSRQRLGTFYGRGPIRALRGRPGR
jgi:hypothetical protein